MNEKQVVIGVGGGGQNIINYFKQQDKNNFRLICVNSDEQMLNTTCAEKWLLNDKRAIFDNDKFITKLFYKILKRFSFYKPSLGCGGEVQTGEKIVQKHLERIKKEFTEMDKIIFVSTFGGGFGTGVTPILVKTALDMGIGTKVFVTTPFGYEGKKRAENAQLGISKLKQYSCNIHIINNQDVLENLSDKITFKNALDIISKQIYETEELGSWTKEMCKPENLDPRTFHSETKHLQLLFEHRNLIRSKNRKL